MVAQLFTALLGSKISSHFLVLAYTQVIIIAFSKGIREIEKSGENCSGIWRPLRIECVRYIVFRHREGDGIVHQHTGYFRCRG